MPSPPTSSSSPSPPPEDSVPPPTADTTSEVAPAAPTTPPQSLRPLRGPTIKQPPVPPNRKQDFTEEDGLPGKQYTNFELKVGSKDGATIGAGKDAKAWTQVLDIPDDGSMKYYTVTINPEKILCFSGRSHWMSNFHRAPARIDGNDYPTVEHYYQACKLYMLGGSRFSNQIRRIPDAGNVKVTARRLLRNMVTDRQIEQWKIVEGPRLLEYGMMHKFVQNPKIRTQLLDTGDSLLVHAYDRDKVFASNMTEKDFKEWAEKHSGEVLKFPAELSAETVPYFPLIGEGKNLLGLITMGVRDQIRRYVESLESQKEGSESGEKSLDAVLAAALGAINLSPMEMERDSGARKAGGTEGQRGTVGPQKIIKKDNRYFE